MSWRFKLAEVIVFGINDASLGDSKLLNRWVEVYIHVPSFQQRVKKMSYPEALT